MVNTEMANILAGLGAYLAHNVDDSADGVYLYAESDGGSYDAGVFRDVGDSVVYFDPSDALFDQIIDLWDAAKADAKWAVLEYQVVDGKFDAKFAFPDELDPEEYVVDRRGRALRARYGDKPIDYGPLDENFHELTEDDLSKD
jgi:hypothetical protein